VRKTHSDQQTEHQARHNADPHKDGKADCRQRTQDGTCGRVMADRDLPPGPREARLEEIAAGQPGASKPID
jgi:hypothetical protein